MTIFYSPSGRSFHDDRLKGVVIPDDAVEITPEERLEALEAERQGGEIITGANGKPTTRPRQATPQERATSLVAAVNRHIEEEARRQGFSSILDAVSYADEPTEPNRQARGIALRQWRSQCMVALDAALQLTIIPQPQALIAQLPDAP